MCSVFTIVNNAAGNSLCVHLTGLRTDEHRCVDGISWKHNTVSFWIMSPVAPRTVILICTLSRSTWAWSHVALLAVSSRGITSDLCFYITHLTISKVGLLYLTLKNCVLFLTIEFFKLNFILCHVILYLFF